MLIETSTSTDPIASLSEIVSGIISDVSPYFILLLALVLGFFAVETLIDSFYSVDKTKKWK